MAGQWRFLIEALQQEEGNQPEAPARTLECRGSMQSAPIHPRLRVGLVFELNTPFPAFRKTRLL